MVWLLLAAGIVALVIGAELLVRGASRLALRLGISPLVIGLTVVAYSTSAPEMVVSVVSSLNGNGAVALGNVVGSNIFNVLFILGLSALVVPLRVSSQLVRVEVPLMIAVSVATLLLALDGRIGRLEGILLVAGGVVYTWLALRQSGKSGATADPEVEVGATSATPGNSGLLVNGVLIVAGLGALVLGARWLVDAAVTLARQFGVSELVLGLTVVAAGTSLPEVATSLVAAVRGQRDIAVGNVVGSNLVNLLLVLGLAGTVAPGGLAVPRGALVFDLPVMVAVAIACLPVFFSGSVISRWEGAVFLGYYSGICHLPGARHVHAPLVAAVPGGAVRLRVAAHGAHRAGGDHARLARRPAALAVRLSNFHGRKTSDRRQNRLCRHRATDHPEPARPSPRLRADLGRAREDDPQDAVSRSPHHDRRPGPRRRDRGAH